MKIERLIIGLLALAGVTATASAQTWSAGADWSPPTNPTGVWSYGEMNSSSVFVPLAWDSINTEYDMNYSPVLGGDVWENQIGYPSYGIANDQIALNSAEGSATVQFTAPSAGNYSFYIAIGGTVATQNGGTGNADAALGNVYFNGANLTRTSFDVNNDNIALWQFSDRLSAGEAVDAYVLNSGASAGANTALTFTVNAVPEPAPYAVLGLGALGLLIRRRRR